MIAEPSTESGDTKPSAEASEFADFFERGARGAYADGQVSGQEPLDPDVDEAPLITAEQLARRTRLQRAVGVLVTALGIASLVLFAARAAGPSLDPVPVKTVSTAVGAASPELSAPASPTERTPEPEAPKTPALPAAPSRQATGAQTLGRATSAESPRRVVPLPKMPSRASTAPAPVPTPASVPARQSPGSAEFPPTASFPIDPQ